MEILAPAGTYEAFEAAIRSGADAVYAGGNLFGARAYAGNFDEETMIRAIREAHLYGRKLYLTVNTLIKEREMKERLYSFLKPFYENGLDAVLVQDLGALAFIREQFPDLAIHASTQMSVAGALGAGFLKQYGVERVVPARELSLAEIRKMKEETGLEIECFVQGALCYSYSGQCLFSSMLGGRSGNRGQCAQPCRLKYQAEGQKKPSCILSLKDIMALEDLPDLIEAGVDSFKIEGRMKKPEYVSETVRVYRKYTDLYLKKGRAGYQVSEEDKQRLMDLYNRGGSCRGYYHVQNGPEMLTPDRSNHAGIHSACVERQKGRSLLAKALVPLQKGDVLEISPKENVTLGQDVKKGGQFQLLVAKGTTVRPRTILARVRNERLIQEIQERIRTAEVRRPVQAKAMFCMDEPSKLILKSGSFSVRVEGSSPQAAKKQAVDRARVERQLRKMGNTPFQIESLEMEMEDGIFIPMQVVNELRRTAAERLEEEILKQYKRSCKRVPMVEQEEIQGESLISREGQKNVLSVLVETKNQLRVAARSEDVRRIYVESHLAAAMCSNQEEREEIQRLYEESKIPWYIVLPHIFRERAKRLLDSRWKAICEVPWKGALVRNVESLAYLQKKKAGKTRFVRTIICIH
ncbi:peptidase U32 family protein [Sellimonas intestinalis]|uniref:peptidase U32 family protein n=2 Tax=Sellimonas intestinalis TaxID=1653434 RepID=UPI00399A2A37